jgi:hypothetical protein
MGGVTQILLHIYHLHLEARQAGMAARPAP